MSASHRSRLLEVRIGLVKARARAKQQWLERMLSFPPGSQADVVRRKRWIAHALNRIKRAQTDAMYRASVLDAYTEHLSVLEMTLMGAAEEKPAAPGDKAESSKS